MTCKGVGGKKSKYMYYFCDNCNLYYNEDEIEDCLIDYIIDKINFRSSFVEQIDKLYDNGVVDFPTMLERGGKLEDTRISVNMNNEQLQDYLSTLKKELDIKHTYTAYLIKN